MKFLKNVDLMNTNFEVMIADFGFAKIFKKEEGPGMR
jgi:hypothetical protein